jgi:UPF0716 protein FxsA
VRGFLLLFIIMPIAEMWLLLQVGGEIGALPTIGLVLLTATIGFQMLRKQGFDTLQRGNFKMEQGQMPAQEMAEGLMLAVSGALLLTPGFITDAIGFAGLTPAFRHWLFKQISKNIQVSSFQTGTGQTYTQTSYTHTSNTQNKGETYEHPDTHRAGHIEPANSTGETIDGDFKREE